MQDPLQPRRLAWIETFRCRSRLDLLPKWHRCGDHQQRSVLTEPWGAIHRPDWAERGLLIWPRGGVWLDIEQVIRWPSHWLQSSNQQERLVLSWWADEVRVWVDDVLVHSGDLFDTRCRWVLPERWRSSSGLRVRLQLRSPCHDDGALISSQLVREPLNPKEDPDGCLLPEALDLLQLSQPQIPESWLDSEPSSDQAVALVQSHLAEQAPANGVLHWVGHAHLDLAWLWPVADTWQAAERTFRSALALMERWPDLHFAHSTPALYAWMAQHRPALFARIQEASRKGRWEPINGPWVETDCVLISTASLWRQFDWGQKFSRQHFPEWRHDLAWLPDSFGFGAGLPAVANATGVQWFCTHKLAWNATNPFPHRLFRWRGRGSAEVMALMLPGIGTDADPVAMGAEQLKFQQSTGIDRALWLPGVGDHGGGPTAEMLEQLQLWQDHPQSPAREGGTVRGFLQHLEPLRTGLPVWRDELYLELHRGCATSRPDQKRHNRTLERLLREADLVAALLGQEGQDWAWLVLLFHQFHDILPGTAIPEVFDQAEPQWRAARRAAAAARDAGLKHLLSGNSPAGNRPGHGGERFAPERWAWCALQPLPRWSPLLRLPRGQWSSAGRRLPVQAAAAGGVWVQLPMVDGVSAVPLARALHRSEPCQSAEAVRDPVQVTALESGGWRLSNAQLSIDVGPLGLIGLRDAGGGDCLAAPLRLNRYRDHGEFWDAWDLAEDYRKHPLPMPERWQVQLQDSGPLVARVTLRGQFGVSALRMDVLLCADSPHVELLLSVQWRQSHELLRLECPLLSPAVRWASDTSGGVIERPAVPRTPMEKARWEVPVISWLASVPAAPGGGLALLLDGPQGVDAGSDHLGVSLLRGPTWPDPSADAGWHRQRVALMPLADGWMRNGVPQAAIRFREPGWHGPVDLQDFWQGLPAVPDGLIPLAMKPSMAADGTMRSAASALMIQLLNPGAQRLRWLLDDGWTMPTGETSIQLMPGELREVRLVRQSS
ncbi:alpha-mannosidase [Synechococcus sp. PROS-7-1]|uniref:alpha-mannosidase n=1 Tax=Synechococcus sp. PROS-7-1 TaxID=1442556 RepID=UPI00351C10D1